MAQKRWVNNKRILQIIPADGWWVVYGLDDGTVDRSRVIAFALADTRDTEFNSQRQRIPAEDNDEVDRVVVPITNFDDYIDIEEADNFLGVVHIDEWDTMFEEFERRAMKRISAKGTA